MSGALGELREFPAGVEERRLEALERVLQGLAAAELYWLSGYLHGRARALGAGEGAPPSLRAAPPAARLTVVYGSQTGNARRVAEALVARAEAQGLAVRLLRADAYPTRELASERALLVAISTQGDGDPPDDARAFLRFLNSARAPRLESLRYAVIGLGDSSYPQFCAIGIAVDARLAELGATRLSARADADVDIDAVAEPFARDSIAAARQLLESSSPRAKVTPLRPPAPTHGRERPFAAPLLASQRLTARDSERVVQHLELDLAGSGLRYQPGDALGVWATQDPALVARVLALSGLDAAQPVRQGSEELPLGEWLSRRRELTRLARSTLTALAGQADPSLQALLADSAATQAFLRAHQLPELLARFAPRVDAATLVSALPPLQPRLYSIASSALEVGEEVHLTVAERRDLIDGEWRRGLASGWLLQRAEDASLPVFVEANERFRLPADSSRDLIMIGPGTGVAPFRAFLQERSAQGASGRHWLFFGHRHLRREFLYQTEWLKALSDGRLQRLDVAFSRDGDERVYVQQRLRERARELVDWIDGGAALYLCGDATRMAPDVHRALREILAEVRAIDSERAEAELDQLAEAGRYLRDVY